MSAPQTFEIAAGQAPARGGGAGASPSLPGGAPADRPSGMALYAEIEAHIAAVGISKAEFCRRSGLTEQTVLSIRHAERPLERTVARVRAAICGGAAAGPVVHVLGQRRNPRSHRRVPGYEDRLDDIRARMPAPARPAISEAAAREAEEAARRRAVARSTGTARKAVPITRLPAGAALQAGMIETVGDTVAAVQRRWPEIWARIVAQAGAARMLPGALLADALEMGLDAMEAGE